jgi:hypothetical protein
VIGTLRGETGKTDQAQAKQAHHVNTTTKQMRIEMDQYEEHQQHSTPDNSRFDGFDRGDVFPPNPSKDFEGTWEDIEF